MKKLNPVIMFNNGLCKAALDFYKTCLNGEITFLTTYAEAPFDVPDELKEGVFNSGFQAGDMYFEATDSFPPYEVTPGTNYALFVKLSGDEPLDNIFTNLAADGGNIMMPLADTGNGKFGMCADKFGIQWMVSWSPE
ncbi:MAG: VOC family protein [Chloroflexota bacterium]